MKHYDLIIIWSGGGTKLRPAADIGKTVAIIEKEELWWTCLNKWCIPSKMLIYPSDLATHAKSDAKKLHISGLENPMIDFTALVEDVNHEIRLSSDSIAPIYDVHENITLYRGHAKFIWDKIIEVNGETLTAEKIFIATGSRPQIPNIPGLEGTPFMTSKEALRNTILPKSMIVIWGWYIAAELWHVYAAAGCDIQFIVRSEILAAEDKDIRKIFQDDFVKRHKVALWESTTKVAYTDGIFSVETKDCDGNTHSYEAESLFLATGVVPNTENLWLENTSIKTTIWGYVCVDAYLQTAVEWVFALWDVVWNYLFRHSVNYEGEYLLSQLYEWAERAPISYPPVPHAVFSYPQIAGVWYSEDELLKQGKILDTDYVTAVHQYKNSAMWSAMKAEVWMVKLIADKNSWTLIWAHIVWEKASDLIHMLIVLISAELRVDFMTEKMIFIHPALSEVIRNAARKLVLKL